MSQPWTLFSLCALLCAIVLCPETGEATTYATKAVTLSETSDALFKMLIKNSNYSRFVRPADQSDGGTWVQIDLAVLQLIDLYNFQHDDPDEQDQILIFNGWKILKWKDHRLKWDTSTNTTLTALSNFNVRRNQIWMPDVVLYSDIRLVYRDEERYFVSIAKNGMLSSAVPIVIRTPCSLNMANFPFDEHHCSLKFGSWAYDASRVNLSFLNAYGDLTKYESDNEFWIVGIPAKRGLAQQQTTTLNYYDVTYTMILRRKPLFYQYNLILPCIALIVVTLFSFRLPPESGERISLGVTILLALSLFLQLVGHHTPPQSESVPLISLYFGATIIVSSIATLSSVLIIIMHYQGRRGDAMPEFARTLVLRYIATVVFLKDWAAVRIIKEEYITTEHEIPENDDMEASTAELQPKSGRNRRLKSAVARVAMEERQQAMFDHVQGVQSHPKTPLSLLSKPLREINQSMRTLEAYTWDLIRQEAVDSEWEAAAFVVDRMLLIIFSITCILITIIVVWVMPPYQTAAPGEFV